MEKFTNEDKGGCFLRKPWKCVEKWWKMEKRKEKKEKEKKEKLKMQICNFWGFLCKCLEKII